MRKILASVGLLIAIALVVLIRSTGWLITLGGKPEGARLARVRNSPQFRDGRFQNTPAAKMIEGSMFQMMKRQFFGDEQRTPSRPVPVARRVARDYETAPKSGLRATWIGWATVLVEIDGRRVLTDPVWSDRCSPTPLVGPNRLHEIPIALSDLPYVDAVVISHDHYDHLDMPAVQALAARGTHFFVPLGVGAHLARWKVPETQVHDLDWNESATIADLTITATPSRHYSGRNPLRGNGTLWASWAIKGPRHRVWFSGDTGSTDAFTAIGAEHGPFDLTIIKIGAYDRSWRDIHFEPEAAIAAHRDVRGAVMLPVHWATFNLAIHEWSEPPERALAAAQSAGVNITIPRPGEMIDSTTILTERWWK